jgi:tetratricopeptide (TPR) repeat protein
MRWPGPVIADELRPVFAIARPRRLHLTNWPTLMRGFSGGLVFATLLSLLSTAGRAEQRGWIEVRSANFIVVSNAGEKQARKAARQFEEIRAVFRQSLGSVSSHPTPVVTVIAVKDERSMREFLPEHWTKGHSHPTGYFASLLNQDYAAVQLDAPGTNPYEPVYHEYYHAISTPYLPELPLWLAEGMAEFFGHTEINERRVVVGEADAALLHELRNKPLIPLNLLFAADRTSPYYNEADKTSMFYAESWALTHYLMIGDGMAHRPMLDAFLSGLAERKRSAEDGKSAFGDLKKLQDDLQNYIQRARYSSLSFPPPQHSEAEMKIRPLSDAEAAAYRGGLFVVRGRAEEATATLEEALQHDPNIALAYQNLAIAQYLEGQREKALQSVTKAIALDPKNSFTRYLRAYLTTGGSKMMPASAHVEEDLREAIALNPDFDPPYALLAVQLEGANKDLPEAFSFAQHAVSSEPANSDYELALAQVLVKMNKFDEAAAAAAQAEALAKNPVEKNNADNFISFLQTVRDYHSDSDR